MNAQYLYNPYTKELRVVDLATVSHSEIAKLYQQGWQTPTQADYSSARNVSYQGAPPPISVRTPPPTTPVPSALGSFVDNGSIDLMKVAASGNTEAITSAREIYGDQMAQAIEANKIPVTVDQYLALGSGAKKSTRIVLPVSLEEWNSALARNDTDFLLKHYPEAKGVSETSAAKLGPGVLGRTAFIQPTLLEKLTFWNESKNEKPTLGGFANEITDVIIPFKDVARNWKRLSNWERGAYLALDLTFLGALAGGPALRASARTVNTVMRSTLTTRGKNVLVKEFRALNAAIDRGSKAAVKESGYRLKYVAQEVRKMDPGLGRNLEKQANVVIANAGPIAEGTYKGTGQLRKFRRNVKGFIRDESGQVGRYRVRSTREIGIEQARVAGAEAAKKELGTKTARVAQKVAERPVIDWGEAEKGFWKKVADDLVKNADDIAQGKRIRGMTREQLRKEAKRQGRDVYERARGPAKPDKRARPFPTKEEKEAARKEWREHLEKIGKKEDSPAIRELIKKMDKEDAAKIVNQARENEEKIYRMAAKTFDELERMKIPRLDQNVLSLPSEDLLALLAKDPIEFAKLLSKTSYTTQLAIRSRLRNLTKTPTQTRALALTITKGDTRDLTRPQVAALADLQDDTKERVKAVALIKMDLGLSEDTKQKLVTDVIVDTVPEPSTKHIIPPSPGPKPGDEKPPDKTRPPTDTKTRPKPDDRTKQKKKKKKGVDFDPVVLKAEGIPDNPGIVVLPQGIVDWRIKPPFRKGGQDIAPVHRKDPAEGEGSPQRGLRVEGGPAPEKLTLQLSRKVAVDIVNGSSLRYRRPRGPHIIDTTGRAKRQRKGTLLV